MCPWNRRFAAELPDESPYAAREVLAGKDARTLARELLLQTTQGEFSRAFSKSPMKRAKLRGLKRNAALVLGNVGTVVDDEPLVRSHVAWALGRLGAGGPAAAAAALRDRLDRETDDAVRAELAAALDTLASGVVREPEPGPK